MYFPEPRTINGFSITIGSANAQITLILRATPEAEAVTLKFEGKGSEEEPILSFDFPEPMQVRFLRLEMLDPYSPPPAQIHIWELKFR